MVAPRTNKFKFCGFFSFFWHPCPPWGQTASGYINDFVSFSAIFDWKRPLVEFITWQIPVLCKPVCFMSIKHGNLYTFDNHFLIFPNLSSTDLERNKEKFPTVLLCLLEAAFPMQHINVLCLFVLLLMTRDSYLERELGCRSRSKITNNFIAVKVGQCPISSNELIMGN